MTLTNQTMHQTTAQSLQDCLNRDSFQRNNQGSDKLMNSELIHDGIPGSGTCKWAAKFTYVSGKIETMWGA